MKDERRLTLYLHKTFFVVKLHDRNLIPTMYGIINGLKTYQYVWNRRFRRMTKQEDKTYCSVNLDKLEYRFTISMLRDVVLTFKRDGVEREDINLIRVINKNIQPLGLKFRYDKFTLRDYQQTYNDILVNEREKRTVMLVDLEVGKGKSGIGAHSLTVIDEKVLLLVLPKYIQKWIDDMHKYTHIKDEDICVIQGSKKIRELMTTDSDKLKYKVYIASITTLNYMISDFEDPTGIYYTTYPMEPDKFMDHLGVGVILNDETHQHFHALLKISLYMNVNQIIGLSATLDSNRAEMKKMYNHMFPPENRISNIVAIDRYVNVLAIEYKMISLKGIKYLQGGQGYSHIVFEQSILRNKSLRESYMEMIYYYVKSKYLDRKLPGERCLIFMSTVMFCTLFTKYLKSKHKNMDIRRYCQDDPYENVINAEICVSTVISASTAVDIPKLITVVNTISMASLQANIQTMGRLRKIPDRDTWYVYMYTPQILNQKNMHKIRRDTIKDRAKCVYYAEYPKYLQSN